MMMNLNSKPNQFTQGLMVYKIQSLFRFTSLIFFSLLFFGLGCGDGGSGGDTFGGQFRLDVVGGSGSGSYAAGARVLVKASLAPQNQRFELWSGDVETLDDPYQDSTAFIMPARNVTLKALYAILDPTSGQDYAFLTVVQGEGDGEYLPGSVVSIEADPDTSAFRFERWSGDITTISDSSKRKTSLVMPSQPVKIRALFSTGGTRRPYSGQPIDLPGRLEAENYDIGGQGVSYNDVDTVNSGRLYRQDAVDIFNNVPNIFQVGWIKRGEWLEYTVFVEEAQDMAIVARVTQVRAGAQLQLSIDGTSLTGPVDVPVSGASWTTHTDMNLGTHFMSEGLHILRITSVRESPEGWTGDIDRLEFRAIRP